MALSGLDIYKLLPRTNCKACGFATCLAFAMALAQKRTALDKCPHVGAAAKEALESASQPPIQLVTIGSGGPKVEIGNETVMFRHEEKFVHPAGIGFLIEDTLDADEVASAVESINALVFERAGQHLAPDLVCIKNASGYQNRFANTVRKVALGCPLNLILAGTDHAAIVEGIGICKERRPLILCERGGPLAQFIATAKAYGLPLGIACSSIDEASVMTAAAKAGGVEEIVIACETATLASRIQCHTHLRRLALKRGMRALGYPTLVFTGSVDADQELAEAVAAVAKYAGIVVTRHYDRSFVLPLLVARQDIYADPQKPVQVQPRVYEVGAPTRDSPVLITTNFSITYFTVAGEVEASKIPSYIICADAEGMSVLTAWAADKFTAETIAATLKKSGIEEIVRHRTLIIPGYVAVLSGKLAELSGWKVVVGPREASGIVQFMRSAG